MATYIHTNGFGNPECQCFLCKEKRAIAIAAEKSDPLERVAQPVVTEAYAVLSLIRAGWTLTPPKGKP
jgi:hypothetical protein